MIVAAPNKSLNLTRWQLCCLVPYVCFAHCGAG